MLSDIQGLLLVLSLGITLGGLKGPNGMPGIKPRLDMCKGNILPVVGHSTKELL